MTGTLLVRADGGPQRGAGHVMRCLALAQGWRDAGGTVTFVFAEPPGPLLDRVRDEGFGGAVLETPAGSDGEARATARRAAREGCRWIVVDGYHLGAAYRRRLAADHRLLVVDDEGGDDLGAARLVLNQNLHAHPDLYPGAEMGRLLLGPRHLLLRDEFLRRRGEERRHPPRVRRLLLTFGGADPRDGAARVLEALAAALPGSPDLAVTVVQGPHHRRPERLREAARRAPFRVDVRTGVTDMAPLMLEADLALTSGGTTVWEMAFLRLPALVVTTGEVEERLAGGLRRTGLFHVLGSLDAAADPGLLGRELPPWLDDPERRRRAGRRGREVVDGEGRRRVVEAMQRAAGDGAAEVG